MPRYHVTIQQAVVETTKVEIEADNITQAGENALLQLYNIMQDGSLDWEYFDTLDAPLVETVKQVK
jgi:hypothetical protein